MPDDGGRKTGVTEQEMMEAFSGDAPGANRFIVTVGSPGVRISFLEQNPASGLSHFRSAVTLHPLDAIALQRLLADMLKGIEKKFVPDPSREGGDDPGA